eukprot:CAMPEP_0184670990 /NCGR_PEP_ID=MMETSP0308-20130426/84855_1 /TAXON_ID=38269 /ORGANISM="Gloeochaete witrockiana, Strain SAG 46.84" /LENGTH=45 /DNA_ID= /DNA_START= /DNA_END= /DNA_ORIENTATION=
MTDAQGIGKVKKKAKRRPVGDQRVGLDEVPMAWHVDCEGPFGEIS